MRKFLSTVLFLMPTLVFGFGQSAEVGLSLRTIKDPTYKYIGELSPTAWKVTLNLQGFTAPVELIVTVDKGVITCGAVVKTLDTRPSLRLTEFLGNLNTATNLLGFFTTVSQGTQFWVVYQSKIRLDSANQNLLITHLADAAGTANGLWDSVLVKQQ